MLKKAYLYKKKLEFILTARAQVVTI